MLTCPTDYSLPSIWIVRRERQSPTRAKAPLRWVPPEQWHLTLAFMPAVDEADLAKLRSELASAFEEPSFDLVFGGLGVFPKGGPPRVLWIGLEAGVAELRALEAAVRRRLRQAGLVTEDRSFSPHLTLARWKARRGSDRLLVRDSAVPGTVARVRLTRTVLYESHLSSSG